jgi:hypothetical protein
MLQFVAQLWDVLNRQALTQLQQSDRADASFAKDQGHGQHLCVINGPRIVLVFAYRFTTDLLAGRTPEEWYEAKEGFFFMLSYGT